MIYLLMSASAPTMESKAKKVSLGKHNVFVERARRKGSRTRFTASSLQGWTTTV
jgi:hypothetical protein